MCGPQISVVIPVYNEEDVLPLTIERLLAALALVDFELIFVDDGSLDSSMTLLAESAVKDNRVKVVALSRNFGHQAAISAGLHSSSGEAVVLIDADLQDPPELIPEMMALWKQGFEVVNGIRTHRKGESWPKRVAAHTFYRYLRRNSEVNLPVDIGDFKLLSRKVVDVLNLMPERQLYMRGMSAWVGFKQVGIEYVRDPRAAGISKYPWAKSIKLSIVALTSFSVTPLKWLLKLAALVAGVAFVASVWVIFAKMFYHVSNQSVPGWTSLLVVVLWLGSAQLAGLAVIGAYIAQIAEQVRGRPPYIVSGTINLGPRGLEAHSGGD